MWDMAMGADMMDVGAMDMGIGAMDMGIGAMDMQMGAMEMAMGDPIGGMELMAIGQMDMAVGQYDMTVGQYDMAMGQNLMGVGMMEAEMGIMGPGMLGAGMMGGGGMMGRRVLPMGGQMVQPPMMGGQMVQRPMVGGQMVGQPMMGQMRPQAYPPPNMTQQQMMMRQQQVPVKQGNYQIPPNPPNNNPVVVRQGNVSVPPSEQKLQYAKQMQRQQQQLLIRKQQILLAEKEKKMKEQQELKLKQQQQQLKVRQQQQLKMKQQQLQLQQMKKKTDELVAEQGNTVKQLDSKININPYLKQPTDVLFMGRVHRMDGTNWSTLENATITHSAFVGIPIASITKMKVKAESKIPGGKMLKISTYERDYFFSVQAEEQIEWMTKLLLAKLATLGHFPPDQYFSGVVEGQVLKKSFFGNWEPKMGVISGSVFKIMAKTGGSVDKAVAEVDEIWTRFERIDNRFVVKMHSFGKLEVGVPMEDVVSWMQGFFTLIR